MDAYVISICIIAGIYALLAIGLNIQYGETGLINFGHVAYFAIGAYASAILAGKGVPVPLAIVLAGLVAALGAIPIGLAALRLKEDYFAIVTLGFAEAVRIFVQQEDWLTNGVQGIASIPPLFSNSTAQGYQNHLFALVIVSVVIGAMIAVALLQKARSDAYSELSGKTKSP